MHPPPAIRLISGPIAAAVVVAAAGFATTATAGPAHPEHHDHAAASIPAASAAAPASAAEPSAGASPRPGASPATPERRDPLEAIRERLARRLGAVPPPGGAANVVRLATPAQGPAGNGAVPATATGGTVRRVAHRAGPGTPHAAARAAAAPGPTGPWDYSDGRNGPLAWSRLDPAYAACASGTRQSPIDIRGGVRVELDPVRFDYRPGAFRVLDTGHTVQVNVAPGSSIEVGERRYELLQFHFHRPSEERIDGRQFAMAAHLVHRSADGRLAIVAVLLEPGPAQPLVQAVWNNLPLERGEEAAARAPLDPSELLPGDRRYATYRGSLTEPPCTEGVLWVVIRQPVGLAAEQEAVFAHLYPMNARPLQAAAGRLIKESN